MSKTAYSYIRWSSAKQGGDRDSLRRQTEAAAQWAESHGYKLSLDSYIDAGVSGSKGDGSEQDGLQSFVAAIGTGHIKAGSVLIIESLDRIGRRGYRATQRVVDQIIDLGVAVYALRENILIDGETVERIDTVIRVAMAASLAYEENEKRRARVRAAKAANRAKASAGIPIRRRLPFWLSFVDGQYQFTDSVETVRRIIAYRQEGRSLSAIVKLLNTNNVPTPLGRSWSQTTVGALLSTPALFGRYVYGTTDASGKGIDELGHVDHYYPAVLSYTEWLSIQHSSKKNVGGQTKANPFAEMLKCGSCNGPLYRKFSKQTGLVNYQCVNSTRKACEQNQMLPDLAKFIPAAIALAPIEKTTTKADGDLLALDNEIARLQKLIDEIAIELESGQGSVSLLSRAAAAHERSIAAITPRRDELLRLSSASPSTLAEIDAIADPARYNMILRTIVDRIVCECLGSNNRWKITVYWKSGYWAWVQLFRSGKRSEWLSLHNDLNAVAGIVDDLKEWERESED